MFPQKKTRVTALSRIKHQFMKTRITCFLILSCVMCSVIIVSCDSGNSTVIPVSTQPPTITTKSTQSTPAITPPGKCDNQQTPVPVITPSVDPNFPFSLPSSDPLSPSVQAETLNQTGTGNRVVYCAVLRQDQVIVGVAKDFQDRHDSVVAIAFLIRGPGEIQFSVYSGSWSLYSNITNSAQGEDLVEEALSCSQCSAEIVRVQAQS